MLLEKIERDLECASVFQMSPKSYGGEINCIIMIRVSGAGGTCSGKQRARLRLIHLNVMLGGLELITHTSASFFQETIVQDESN